MSNREAVSKRRVGQIKQLAWPSYVLDGRKTIVNHASILRVISHDGKLKGFMKAGGTRGVLVNI